MQSRFASLAAPHSRTVTFRSVRSRQATLVGGGGHAAHGASGQRREHAPAESASCAGPIQIGTYAQVRYSKRVSKDRSGKCVDPVALAGLASHQWLDPDRHLDASTVVSLFGVFKSVTVMLRST